MTKVRDKYTSVRFLRDCLRLTLQRPGGALSEWDLEKSDVQKLLEDCQIFLQLGRKETTDEALHTIKR